MSDTKPANAKKPKARRSKRPADALQEVGDQVASLFSMEGTTTAKKGIRPHCAVETNIWPFNYLTQVGGLLLWCLHTIYGQSRHGKTLLLLLKYRAMLGRGGIVYHLPLERGDDSDFFEAMLGEFIDHPRFLMPAEGTVLDFDTVRGEAQRFAASCRKVRHEMGADGIDWVGGMFGVDSLTALQPSEVIADVSRDGRFEDYAKRGNQDYGTITPKQRKSAMDRIGNNAHWLRLAQHVGGWMWQMLEPFYVSQVTGAFITQCAQIGEESSGGMRAKKVPIYGPKLGRGTFEPCVTLIRVDREDVHDDDGVKSQCHRIVLQKNKGGAIPEGRERSCRFFMRKDRVELDHVRNLLEGCMDAHRLTGEPVIEEAGSWFKFEGKTLCQGRPKMLRLLREDDDLFARVETSLREHELRTRSQRRGLGGK